MLNAKTSTRSLALRSLPHLPPRRDRQQKSSKAPPPSPPLLQAVRRIKKIAINHQKILQRLERARHHNGGCRQKGSRSLAMNHHHHRLCTPRIRRPGSFGGALRPFVGTLFDRRDAQRYLRTQDAYTLHRQARRRFPHRKTHLKGIADLYQADLVDLLGLSNFNNSYRYLLTCIDVFTERAWAIPLRRKTGKEVTTVF